MNIVFFGTSGFAIPSLREISNSRHKILALVTQPDRKRGRNLKLEPPPTKILAQTHSVPVYQPQNASGPESVNYLRNLKPDLFVVASFGQILKKEILAIPKLYSINLHASILPRYRGAAPTNWAVINGDETTGVTVIRMTEGMDEGDMILRKEAAIDKEDTNITLNEKLSEIGAGLLLEAMDLIEAGKAHFEKQDSGKATPAPKLKKRDGLIDWSEPAAKVHDRVRGLLPWPGAHTYYDGKIMKILKTEVLDSPAGQNVKNGEIVDIVKNRGIIVHTGAGNLIIKHLQIEGKKILDADSFVRGRRISKGYIFGR